VRLREIGLQRPVQTLDFSVNSICEREKEEENFVETLRIDFLCVF